MSDERAFETALDEYIESLSGDFVAAVVAEKFVAQLREKQPGAVEDWLDRHCVALVTEQLTKRIGATRNRAAQQVKRKAFADAVEDDDTEALSQFADWKVIDAENTRRKVADMTGADHAFVADAYGRSGRYDLMLEAFHKAVAKKVGKRRTADVLTEEQYGSLFASLTRAA